MRAVRQGREGPTEGDVLFLEAGGCQQGIFFPENVNGFEGAECSERRM